MTNGVVLPFPSKEEREDEQDKARIRALMPRDVAMAYVDGANGMSLRRFIEIYGPPPASPH